MKLIYYTFILSLLVLGNSTSAQWLKPKTIFSQALQQEKTYYVGLPTGYNPSDTSKKYPVILFLHGASVTATELVNTISPYLDIMNMLTGNRLYKVIFIIPDGYCDPYKGSFYTNSTLYGNYEDYINIDIMKEIGEKYNTYPNREKWSIMGHSMGGFGAMKIALKNPQKFIGVSSLSGPLNITYYNDILPLLLAEHGNAEPYDFTYTGDVTKLVYSMAGAFSPNPGATPPVIFPVTSAGVIDQAVKTLWDVNNPANLVSKWQGTPNMAMHLYCGDKDEYKLMSHNQSFADSLSKYGKKYTFVKDANGDHTSSLTTSFPQGVTFLYNVMDTTKTGVSAEQIVSNDKFKAYPNPANSQIYLSGKTETISSVEIVTISGTSVMKLSSISANEPISILHLPKGVYLINLQSNDGRIHSQRLLKK